MHNVKLIRRRFPRQANAIIAGLAMLALAGIVIGLALLAL
jgi:hypothetical protein